MLHLLWLILNLVLLVGFIIYCFRAARAIQERMGGLAMLLFAVIFLSFMSTGGSNTSVTKEMKVWKNPVKDTGKLLPPFKSKKVKLHSELLFSFDLYISTLKKDAVDVPVQASCGVSGLMGFTFWKTDNIWIQDIPDEDGSYSYFVDVSVSHRLLWLNFANDHKVFSGKFKP